MFTDHYLKVCGCGCVSRTVCIYMCYSLHLKVIHGSIMEDRERVLESSKAIGFLTGYESKVYILCHTHMLYRYCRINVT